MSSLAEANNAPPGRWVLMPRKGKRIMEPRERTRFRVRRRRRQIFMVLLEATLLTLLIGLFPPLHKMLLGAAALGGILLVYVLTLMMIRAEEAGRARLRRAMEATAGRQPRARAGRYAPAAAQRSSYPRPAGSGNGNGNGAIHADPWRGLGRPDPRGKGGLQIVDDDVHVIVYRSDEIPIEAARPVAR